LHRLLALVICCTDGERPLDLTSELTEISRTILADNQEIVSVPAEMLGLQMDFHDQTVVQDWRNTFYKELCEPIGIYMLFKERARPSGRRGTRDVTDIRRIIEVHDFITFCTEHRYLIDEYSKIKSRAQQTATHDLRV
jgi:hypothetical protein